MCKTVNLHVELVSEERSKCFVKRVEQGTPVMRPFASATLDDAHKIVNVDVVIVNRCLQQCQDTRRGRGQGERPLAEFNGCRKLQGSRWGVR
jgi:hypothetical protein